MQIYLAMLLVSVFFASCAMKTGNDTLSKRNYRTFGVLSILPFWIVSCIRYKVGTDWPIYDSFFHSINTGGEKFSEPLFNLLNRFLYLFTKDSTIVFAVVAFLSLSFTFLAIYKQSKYIPFSIIIFFLWGEYFSSMNQLRQALVMAIFLFALKYIINRDWKKYYAIMILATMIHTSALMYFVVYFIYGKKVNLRWHIGIFLGSLAGLPLIKVIARSLLAKTRYGWYLDSVYNLNNFYMIGFVVNMFFLILFEYYAYSNNEQDKRYQLFVNMFFISTLSLLFSTFIPQVDRISGTFGMVMTLAVPHMVLREKDRTRRIVLYMLVVFILALKLSYDVFKNHWYDVLPYQTIFG